LNKEGQYDEFTKMGRWYESRLNMCEPQLRPVGLVVSPAQTASSKKELSEAEMSHMSPGELATYIFEHHGCDSCHTMGSNGKLGYTERGKQVGKGFVGCVSLLTSMNLIAQVDPANRTPDEKEKAVKFREFGCTTCHQIVPGKLGLTSYGIKLKSFHMACTDVEKILSQESKR
jgi:cytochrome c551/c552